MTKKPFIAVLLLAVTACGAPETRTGVSVPPVQLTVVQDLPVFSRLVTGTAGAAVQITSGTDPGESPDPEQVLLEGLDAATFDLAAIRAGRLQLEGVDSLAPLGAPFLVTSDDQARAVATGEVATQLMADLDRIGLVGLALVPEGLRHPFAYGSEPLLGAQDYEDQTIASPRDAGSAAIFAALGASVFTPVDHTRTEMARSGRLRGIEVNFDRMGIVDRPAVATANVSFYYRFDVVVIREAAWDGLTEAQQSELTAAVVGARDDKVASQPTEEESFREWCGEEQAASTNASADELASLHARLDTITRAMADDPETGTVVEAIQALGAGTAEPTDLSCGDAAPEPAPAVPPSGSQTVLDGVWRFEVTEAELLDGGASASDAHGNAGVWEFAVDQGNADVSLDGHRPSQWSFAFDGDRVALDFGTDGGALVGTYALSGDTVTFTWEEVDNDPYPWIGNVLFHEAVRVS